MRPLSPILLLCALTLPACTVDPTVYTCTTNSQCVLSSKQGGTCVADTTGSYCAFASDTCPSKLQWDETAAASLRGQCVELRDMAVTGDSAHEPIDMAMPNSDLSSDMAKTIATDGPPPDLSMPPPDMAAPQYCTFDVNLYDDGCIYGM